MPRLRELIHATDPYEGFDPAPWPADLQGWGSGDPLFRLLFERLRPTRIAEIGSWKGASALHMAQLARALGIGTCEIVCIDTWLGSVEHWYYRDRPAYYPSLRTRHGFPQLYFTFLANVVRAGMQETVTPFPIASSGAARFFAAHGVLFDLVYVDAAHQGEEVALDLALYWPLVRPGGVLFGDDYSPNFPGLVQAVDAFAAGSGLDLQADRKSTKWMIQRSAASAGD